MIEYFTDNARHPALAIEGIFAEAGGEVATGGLIAGDGWVGRLNPARRFPGGITDSWSGEAGNAIYRRSLG